MTLSPVWQSLMRKKGQGLCVLAAVFPLSPWGRSAMAADEEA